MRNHKIIIKIIKTRKHPKDKLNEVGDEAMEGSWVFP